MTDLLLRWREGDRNALDQVVELVYPELLRIARARLAREPGHPSVDAGAVVHEAFVRLVPAGGIAWTGRSHFYAVCSTVMRRILVERARARRTRRRGGVQVTLHDDAVIAEGPSTDVLALDAALRKLEAAGHTFESQTVQMRFFGGLSIEETADALGCGTATVGRAWTFAKAWLKRELRTVSEG